MKHEPFHFHDGRVAYTIAQLLDVLEHSDRSVYERHVSKNHNDFAAWIELSLHENVLAEQLRGLTSYTAAIDALRAHVSRTQAKNPTEADLMRKKEFLIGFGIGLITGIILIRVLMLA